MNIRNISFIQALAFHGGGSIKFGLSTFSKSVLQCVVPEIIHTSSPMEDGPSLEPHNVRSNIFSVYLISVINKLFCY